MKHISVTAGLAAVLAAGGVWAITPAAHAETLTLPPQSTRATTTYVYVGSAAAGGSLDITGTVRDRADDLAHLDHLDITVTDPNGTIKTTTVPGINDPAKPKPITGLTGLTSPTAGVWKITTASKNESGAIYGTGLIQPFSVVSKVNGTEISGRVWWEHLQLEQRDAIGEPNNDQPIDLTLYTLSDTGIQHKFVQYGYQGISSTIAVDNKGVTFADCQSAHRSADWAQMDPSIAINLGIGKGTLKTAGECANDPSTVRYRIFLVPPDKTMPATAKIAGGTTWVYPDYITPTVSAAFTQTDPKAATWAGTVDVTVEGQPGAITVKMDGNADGNYSDPQDRTLADAQQVGTGTTKISWDGKDGQGNPVPRRQKVTFAVALDGIGEIHWLLRDVEQRRTGLAVTELAGPNPGNNKVSWDDTYMSTGNCWRTSSTTSKVTCQGPKPEQMKATDTTDGTAHGWAAGTRDTGTWGDSRFIDDWQRDATAFGTQAMAEVTGTPNLSITKDDGKTIVPHGQQTQYTLTVTNNGAGDEYAGIVRDMLPEHTSYVSSTGAGVYDQASRTVTWPAMYVPAKGQTRVTVTVKVDEDAPKPAELKNVATITGQDQAQPDCANTAQPRCATDIDLTAPPDLRILKTVVTSHLQAGGKITWKLEIANRSEATANNVVVTDQMPASIDPGSITANTPTQGEWKDGQWTVGTLIPQGTASIELTGTLTTRPTSNLVNTARITTQDAPAPTDDACQDNDTLDADQDGCDIATILPPAGGPPLAAPADAQPHVIDTGVPAEPGPDPLLILAGILTGVALLGVAIVAITGRLQRRHETV